MVNKINDFRAKINFSNISKMVEKLRLCKIQKTVNYYVLIPFSYIYRPAKIIKHFNKSSKYHPKKDVQNSQFLGDLNQTF